MLRVVRTLIGIAAVFLCAMCMAQPKDDVRVEIVLRGADTVPEEIKSLMLAELQKQVAGANVTEDFINELGERLRDQFQQHGYFKADIIGPENWPPAAPPTADEPIELVFGVKEGSVYRTGDFHFVGGKHFSDAQLRPLLPLNKGDLFDVEKMRTGIKNLRDFYGEHGFINFTAIPNTEFHEEEQILDVTFDLEEGDQYTFGPMTLDGEEPTPGAGRRLLEAWRPYIGTVDDSSITEMILIAGYGRPHQTAKDSDLARALRGCGPFTVEVFTDKENHVSTIHINLAGPE